MIDGPVKSTASAAAAASPPASGGWRPAAWALAGLMLVALMSAGAIVSHLPATRTTLAGVPIGVLLSVVAGGVYLVGVAAGPGAAAPRRAALWALAVGLAMRAAVCLMPQTPEADYHRYLWDGAVTAAGRSPYRYSPHQAREGQLPDPELRSLAERGADVLAQTNHPRLRTIYPPAAQGLFAVAHWIAPFRLAGWRVVLAAFDALAAWGLWRLLRRLGVGPRGWAVFLWNPLLVTETYFGGHVDLVAASMVVLIAWALVERRVAMAWVLLGLAVAVKLWPAVLAFFLIGPSWRRRWQGAVGLALFVAMMALTAGAMAPALGERATSGLGNFASRWEAVAGAYRLFDAVGRWSALKLGLSIDGGLVGRAMMMVALTAAAASLGLRRAGPEVLCPRLALVVLLMLLLSPVCWPWYYVALVPLAAAAPRRWALLAWTVLLPLWNLPGWLAPPWAKACAVHVPVWLLLAGDWLAARRAAGALKGGGAHV